MTPLPTSSFYREPSKSMGSWREHREEGRTSAARRPAQSACRAGLVCVCVCVHLGMSPSAAQYHLASTAPPCNPPPCLSRW